jgi:hypothetical protein
VTVTPTIVIYKDGELVKRIDGMDQEKGKELRAFLESQ